MIFLASLNMSRPCLSTLMLTIWHIRRLCALWFFIFRFFYFMPIWILVDLNKFKTWKWKGKHRSFLVALKWSWILVGFWNFHVWNPKPLLFMLDFIRRSLGSIGGRYMICLVWICLDLVYQLECLLYDIRGLCALVFHFLIFMPIWESW